MTRLGQVPCPLTLDTMSNRLQLDTFKHHEAQRGATRFTCILDVWTKPRRRSETPVGHTQARTVDRVLHVTLPLELCSRAHGKKGGRLRQTKDAYARSGPTNRRGPSSLKVSAIDTNSPTCMLVDH
jgi:hypothetical protein